MNESERNGASFWQLTLNLWVKKIVCLRANKKCFAEDLKRLCVIFDQLNGIYRFGYNFFLLIYCSITHTVCCCWHLLISDCIEVRAFNNKNEFIKSLNASHFISILTFEIQRKQLLAIFLRIKWEIKQNQKEIDNKT